MNIDKIRSLLKLGKYRLTLHALKRLDQRQIAVHELKEAINNGMIIESYPDDKPYPSCLIMGKIRGGFPLYIVCAVNDNLHIITAHWMDPEKWLNSSTRRDKKVYA